MDCQAQVDELKPRLALLEEAISGCSPAPRFEDRVRRLETITDTVCARLSGLGDEVAGVVRRLERVEQWVGFATSARSCGSQPLAARGEVGVSIEREEDSARAQDGSRAARKEAAARIEHEKDVDLNHDAAPDTSARMASEQDSESSKGFIVDRESMRLVVEDLLAMKDWSRRCTNHIEYIEQRRREASTHLEQLVYQVAEDVAALKQRASERAERRYPLRDAPKAALDRLRLGNLRAEKLHVTLPATRISKLSQGRAHEKVPLPSIEEGDESDSEAVGDWDVDSDGETVPSVNGRAVLDGTCATDSECANAAGALVVKADCECKPLCEVQTSLQTERLPSLLMKERGLRRSTDSQVGWFVLMSRSQAGDKVPDKGLFSFFGAGGGVAPPASPDEQSMMCFVV